jgi:uncharacterized protein YbjT (DUF2867 family)
MIVNVMGASGQLGQKVLKALLNQGELPGEPGC